MERFRNGTSISPLRQIEAYWTALLVGEGVPRRSEIDPRGLENVLENAFILERIAPGVARFRVAGNFLTELAGMEVRGMPITSCFGPVSRTQFSAILEHLFDTPAVAEVTLAGEAAKGQPDINGKMVLLPLQSDLGDITRALGALVVDGKAGSRPRRLEVTNVVFRPVRAPHATSAVPREIVAGFAEEQRPFGAGKPHLRLVKSED